MKIDQIIDLISKKEKSFFEKNKNLILSEEIYKNNMSLLMYCFKFNFLDYADKQIENLKNPYQKDSSGYTVLDYSIKHDVKFFKKIINKFEYIKFDQSKKWPHKF